MTADPMIHCGRGICAAEEGHAGTCDEVSGWAEEEESDVRPVSPARDAELVEFEAVSAARYEAGLSAEGRAARHAALAWGAEFRTKPNPDQPDRCPSIDPHDTLQCTRRIHEDGQCQSGGIAWVKGTPRYMSDAERANRMEGMAERLAALLVDVEERLTGERDRARSLAARLEAENARLREGIERLASMLDTPAHRRPPKAPRFLNEAADDLRALLADTDGAKDEGATVADTSALDALVAAWCCTGTPREQRGQGHAGCAP